MKKVLLIAVALITVNATAQDRKRERQQEQRKEKTERFKDFSPEEIATLQTKRMALQLDLTEAQQKEVKAIHLEQAKKRKAQMEAHKKMMEESKGIKPSKEERFNRMNNQLDNQLATKSKFKSILNKEQFEKFEQANAKKGRQRVKMKGKKGQKQKGQKRQRN